MCTWHLNAEKSPLLGALINMCFQHINSELCV